MTLGELVRKGAETLKRAGIEDPENDSLELLLYAAGLEKEAYFLRKTYPADEETERRFADLVKTRAERVPLQHILGFSWFYGYRFSVTPDVLIPRFDTEVLLYEALKETSGKGLAVLDLCTGSGIIGITLCLEGQYASIAASDISEAALRVAEKNAADLSADVTFYQSDLFSDIPGKFDVIVSNPPYITPEELISLSPEVRDHDPESALVGGEDGLLFYRRIAREGKEHLNSPGRIYFEIGEEQAESVSLILSKEGYTDIRVTRDLTGRDRVVSAVFM